MNPSSARMAAHVTRLRAFSDRLEVERGVAKCRVVDEIDRRFDVMQAGVNKLINHARDQINKPTPTPPPNNKRLSFIKKEEIKEDEEESVVVVTQKPAKRLSSKVNLPGTSKLPSNIQTRKPTQRKPNKRVISEEDQPTAPENGNTGIYRVKVKHINCPEENCTAKLKSMEKYFEHRKQQHDLMRYLCLAKGCGQRFNNSKPLGKHIKDKHRNVTWLCSKCSTEYKSHRQLSHHMHEYHQEGKFLCAQSDCRFMATTRAKVRIHAQMKHASQSKRFICSFEGCGKAFRREFNLQRHERIHLAIKPFSCGWGDGCEHSAKERGHVVRHIRTRHFKLPRTLKAQKQKNIVDTRDPNEYVRVNEHLASRRL